METIKLIEKAIAKIEAINKDLNKVDTLVCELRKNESLMKLVDINEVKYIKGDLAIMKEQLERLHLYSRVDVSKIEKEILNKNTIPGIYEINSEYQLSYESWDYLTGEVYIVTGSGYDNLLEAYYDYLIKGGKEVE